MPITEVIPDTEALTLTVIADFTVPVERLWNAYLDPRQIEQFWGPPEYPATFTRHDGAVGGRSQYIMTSADGDVSAGYWEWTEVDAPNSFEVLDGFAKEDGTPNTDLPNMRIVFSFQATVLGSRLVTTTHFNSAEELEQLVGMGMVEGLRAAMGQIDDVLEDLASFAASRGTEVNVLNDTQVRITRIIRGTPEEVWRAHHEPELVRQWMLGPDGWTMPVCEVATSVGEAYRYEWEPVNAEDPEAQRFGFVGRVLESNPVFREVTTEAMIGAEESETRNELTLTPRGRETLLSFVITYPNSGLRDTVLATGMVEGMEFGYARLEDSVIPSLA